LSHELEQNRINAEAIVTKDFSSATIISSSEVASLVFLPRALKTG